MTVDSPATTDDEFVAHLSALSRDWRYSDEFLGQLVRARWPRNYGEGMKANER